MILIFNKGGSKITSIKENIGTINDLEEFQKAYETKNSLKPKKLNIEHDKVKNGVAQLVLTLIKLLHELLEKQSIRRMEAGNLSDEEVERLGLTLMKQNEEIERLRKEFGLEEKDLNLDLGPLGKLL